jgi:hypothetical protein
VIPHTLSLPDRLLERNKSSRRLMGGEIEGELLH